MRVAGDIFVKSTEGKRNDEDLSADMRLILKCISRGRFCVLEVRVPGYRSQGPGFGSRRVHSASWEKLKR
jgi:hypothetical protein